MTVKAWTLVNRRGSVVAEGLDGPRKNMANVKKVVDMAHSVAIIIESKHNNCTSKNIYRVKLCFGFIRILAGPSVLRLLLRPMSKTHVHSALSCHKR